MSETTSAGLALLRVDFPPHQVNKLPKPYKADSTKGDCAECGGYHGLPALHLDYVGHAALTDRLLDADPAWSWEPLAFDAAGLPALDRNGGMWIKLTVCGVTRLGYGDAQGKTGGNGVKELIGDALRNAAMRFGAALALWHKGDLHADQNPDGEAEERAHARAKWLADWLLRIETAGTVGDAKRCVEEAITQARTEGDAPAEAEFLAASQAKAKALKAKAAGKAPAQADGRSDAWKAGQGAPVEDELTDAPF